VGQGFIASFAQPGGNTTGFVSFEDSISAKWLELLKELVPQASRVGIIRVPAKASSSQFLMRAIETLAASLKVQLTVVEVRDLAEIDGAFDTLSRASIEGLIVMPDPTTLTYRARIIELARERKRQSILTVTSRRTEVSFPMGPMALTSGGERRSMSTAYSRARRPPICPCRTQPGSSWSSTSRPPRRSASSCHCRS
jgi:hypothetical protein